MARLNITLSDPVRQVHCSSRRERSYLRRQLGSRLSQGYGTTNRYKAGSGFAPPLSWVICAYDTHELTLKIVDAVHVKKCFIYLQIWAVGRAATPETVIWEDPILPYVSSSDIPLAGRSTPPRALTKEGDRVRIPIPTICF